MYDQYFNLYDVNLFIGCPSVKGTSTPISSAFELLRELDEHSIKKALVWHIAQHDVSPVIGNELLSKAVAESERLLGCWTILPPQTGEVINESFFLDMKKNRIFALRVFPRSHNFLLNYTVFGDFLNEISNRKIPLLLSLERGIQWQDIYNLLKDFPRLTCILCDIGIWGVDRYTWPLLESYPNLYLETSLLSLEAGGIEAVVKKFGAERLLFGSGFPERYFEASILQLLHSEISESDKEKIASQNLERLIEEVML